MVELVDTRDLKSLDQKRSCGFESRSRHIACKARNAISGYISRHIACKARNAISGYIPRHIACKARNAISGYVPRHIACKIRNETNGVNTRSRQKINSNNNYS